MKGGKRIARVAKKVTKAKKMTARNRARVVREIAKRGRTFI